MIPRLGPYVREMDVVSHSVINLHKQHNQNRIWKYKTQFISRLQNWETGTINSPSVMSVGGHLAEYRIYNRQNSQLEMTDMHDALSNNRWTVVNFRRPTFK